MRYEKFDFLWPPRPEKPIPRALIRHFETLGYVGQIKKNGTGGLLAVSPDRKVTAIRRDNTPHKAWDGPTAATHQTFANLPGNGWYIFVAELLHSKVPGLRNINYINDMLVMDGEYLVQSKFIDRQKMLRDLFPTNTRSIDGHYYIIDQVTWLAHNYETGLTDVFNTLTRQDDEGLVLKQRDAVLKSCIRENSNSGWQVKCRRPTKNYSF